MSHLPCKVDKPDVPTKDERGRITVEIFGKCDLTIRIKVKILSEFYRRTLRKRAAPYMLDPVISYSLNSKVSNFPFDCARLIID